MATRDLGDASLDVEVPPEMVLGEHRSGRTVSVDAAFGEQQQTVAKTRGQGQVNADGYRRGYRCP